MKMNRADPQMILILFFSLFLLARCTPVIYCQTSCANNQRWNSPKKS